MLQQRSYTIIPAWGLGLADDETEIKAVRLENFLAEKVCSATKG
jgi:hypothetical protein